MPRALPIRPGVVGILGLVAAFGVGCDSSSPSDDITVFAAASLTDAFTAIGETFMAENPDRSVTFSFAASSELVAQVLDGAPADVVATADLITMDRLTAADTTASTPHVFARNRATIAVAAGNPLGITGLVDLTDDDLILVVCAPEAPCGRYANQLLANAGIAPTPDSFERNPRAVLTKVALGEADVGIVYETDIAAADGDVDAVPIPSDTNIVAEYPIVTITRSAEPGAAQDFIDIVLSPAGLAILADHGFTSP